MNPLIRLRKASPLFHRAFVLACFALSPQARAVCLEGCGSFAGASTFLGENALGTHSGTANTAIGFYALAFNTSGHFNTAIGGGALETNTAGSYNTATGSLALFSNTTGSRNTATGDQALYSNTSGNYNTASGSYALDGNTTGSYNTASAASALERNSTGNSNTAIGSSALRLNRTGIANTAVGVDALYGNDQSGSGLGSFNSALGTLALVSNTDGADNSAFGSLTLVFNTTGGSNTAIGEFALLDNTTGRENTAIGASGALSHNTTGSGNIALGNAAGSDLTTGDNNIDIGNGGQAGESGTIRIGTLGAHTATYVAGIFGATVTDGVGVIVDTDGHLATQVSSARFKDEIKPMDEASEAIFALKPVTFRYKKEMDPKQIPQFGLVAEEVEKVNPELVVCDKERKPYSVRYDAVNAMLLNEFLKEHRKNEEQEATITRQQKQIEVLAGSLKEQKALIQKVSDKVELSKRAPQMVVNRQ